MFFSKKSVKIITFLFFGYMAYSINTYTVINAIGDFNYNYTNYKYNITSQYDYNIMELCQNKTCYIKDINFDKNYSEINIFENTFDTKFNMTKYNFDKMATKNIKVCSNLLNLGLIIRYIFVFMCIILFI